MSRRTEPIQMRILPDNMSTFAASDTISLTLINSLSGAARDTLSHCRRRGEGLLFLLLPITSISEHEHNPDAPSRETPPRELLSSKLSDLARRQLFVLIIGIIISIFTRDLAGRTRRRRRRRRGLGRAGWEVRRLRS